jgi:hypothetical protein
MKRAEKEQVKTEVSKGYKDSNDCEYDVKRGSYELDNLIYGNVDVTCICMHLRGWWNTFTVYNL